MRLLEGPAELLKEDGRNTGSETYHCAASARLICSAFSLPLRVSDHQETKGLDFPEKKNS